MSNFRLAALTLLVFTSTAFAQPQPTENRPIETRITAKPGEETQAGVFGTPRPDCTTGPRPEVKVIAAPQHGTLRIGPRTLRTSRVKNCPTVELPVIAVFYTSRGDFSGADRVTIEVSLQSGLRETRTVTIDVK